MLHLLSVLFLAIIVLRILLILVIELPVGSKSKLVQVELRLHFLPILEMLLSIEIILSAVEIGLEVVNTMMTLK